jgi:hypothetical protein
MIIRNQAKTIQALTEKMNSKEKFAFINFPRSSLMAISESMTNEKKPSKYFTRSIVNSFNIQHPNYLKGVPPSFIYSSEEDNLEKLSSTLKDNEYYDSTTLEHYYSSQEDIFKSFVDHYIRHSSFVVVSFHDKKIISKVLGNPVDVINVAYNDFYDKTDGIIKSISKYEGKIDYCLFDCPLLSSALPHKIWNDLDVSMIDLGKVFSFARTNYLNKMKERENEKKDRYKNFR